MGKLAKGLIAAAIPIAVIVGIASCGHRPVVMTSAESTTTTYTFDWSLSQTQIDTISNEIYTSTGVQVSHTRIATSGANVFTKRSTLNYLTSFDYSVTNDGEVTILNNFSWGQWDGTYLTGLGYSMENALSAHPEYFIYAYASISNNSLIEYGFPVIRQYEGSDIRTTEPRAVYYQDPRFLEYPAPDTGNDYKITTTYLKAYLKQYIVGWIKQSAAPLIDNQPVFDQGKEQGYQEGYADGLSDGRTDGYDDGFIDGRNQGYREGQNSVTTESTAINNLFASLVSVPINVLNGLMPMAVWNTPIVGIMITFMLLAMLMWLIRKLLAR